ncbi:nucleoside hydrolase [Micromonospora deserti]|nr:nucleoside hydrolase [Micromonospora deserti]
MPLSGLYQDISPSDYREADDRTSDGERTRVIFSTDFGLGLINGRFGGEAGPAPVDDAYAVALAAANSDRFDVRGLVITFGNDVMLPQLRAAERGLHELELGFPVVPGAQVPFSNPPVQFFDGRQLPDWCVNDGVRFMADELREGPLTVFAIGPFTDLACLVQNFPIEARNLEKIVALAGGHGEPLILGGTPVPDLNFTVDPLALKILLAHSDISFVAMMFEVSSTAAISAPQLHGLASGPSPGGRYVGEASLPNATETPGGMIPFDAHTVNYLLNPDAYKCFDGGFTLEVGQPSPDPTPQNQFVVGPSLGGRAIVAATPGRVSISRLCSSNECSLPSRKAPPRTTRSRASPAGDRLRPCAQ